MEDPLAAADELYKEHILDHYANPRNKGSVQHPDLHYRELNPLCGDELEWFITLTDGKVTAAKWQGKGCAISQSAASMLSEELVGKTLAELDELNSKFVLDLLAIPIGPVRLKCAILSLKTLQLALKHR